MFPTANKLCTAINELCVALDKISIPQFCQLEHEQDDDEIIPSVRLSSLNASEVEHILGLEPAKDNQGLNSFPTVPLPGSLIQNLAMTDSALRDETSAEARIRWRMNNFLLFAFNIAMDSHSEEEELLEIEREPRWSFGPVRYKDQAAKLSGHPSYALWYGDEDEAALNVIIAESKGPYKGITEVLGYMGFVYHHRKNANKENYPIYGVATDSKTFHFVRLDNDSTFITATLDSQVDLEKAFSLLVYILKEAITNLSTKLKEISTQSDRDLVPAEASLRRKVDKKRQYERLKVAANNLDEDFEYDDIDSEDLKYFPEDETSEDEYSENE